MKKIIAIFTAALTLALCGCGDSRDTDSELPPVENIPVETSEEPTEPAEPGYADYTEADFTPIKMGLSITDDPPPFEIHSADLSGLDLGERLSPCKAEGEREKYDVAGQTFYDPEMQAQYDAEKERLYNTPSKGCIESAAFLDGRFYFAVDFDDLCHCHDSSVFSFDPETGEMKELTSRTGLEYSCGFDNFMSSGGRLIFTEQDDETFTVYDIDPVSGEISGLFAVDANVYWIQQSPNGLWLCTDNKNDDDGRILEYDVETGERVAKIGEEEFSAGYGIFGLLTCGGRPAEVSDSMDINGPLSVKTAFYSLDTELKKCQDVYLWEDKVSVVSDLSSNYYLNDRRLYTYDFAKMERTELSLKGFSKNLFKVGEGLVDTVESINTNGGSATAYYIAPQLGTAFRLTKSDSIIAMESGGVCCFLASEYAEIKGDDIGNYVIGNDHVPDKIYWFEV